VSPNFPKDYGNNEHCIMQLAGTGARYLEVVVYDVEQGYDTLRGAGRDFVEDMQGQMIRGMIEWKSDRSIVRGGWMLCADDSPPAGDGSDKPASPWVIEGPCKVDPSDSDCVVSPNYPNQYSSADGSCTMSISEEGYSRVEIERVGSLRSTLGPTIWVDGVPLSPRADEFLVSDDTEITWSTQGMGLVVGVWKMCRRGEVAPPPGGPGGGNEEGLWSISGECSVDPSDHECVVSPNYPEEYSLAHGTCTMGMHSRTPRRIELHREEVFRATVGPTMWMNDMPITPSIDGAILHGDAHFHWSTEQAGSVVGCWKLCARGLARGSDGATGTPSAPDNGRSHGHGPGGRYRGPWTVEGACEVDPDDQACVVSPGFPDTFMVVGAVCRMTLSDNAPRRIDIPWMETLWDGGTPSLWMEDSPLTPGTGGMLVGHGATFTWRTADDAISIGSWKICASEAAVEDDFGRGQKGHDGRGGGWRARNGRRHADSALWMVSGPCAIDDQDGECVVSPNLQRELAAPGASCRMALSLRRPKLLEIQRENAFVAPLWMGRKKLGQRINGVILRGAVELQWMGPDNGAAPGPWRVCARPVHHRPAVPRSGSMRLIEEVGVEELP